MSPNIIPSLPTSWESKGSRDFQNLCTGPGSSLSTAGAPLPYPSKTLEKVRQVLPIHQSHRSASRRLCSIAPTHRSALSFLSASPLALTMSEPSNAGQRSISGCPGFHAQWVHTEPGCGGYAALGSCQRQELLGLDFGHTRRWHHNGAVTCSRGGRRLDCAGEARRPSIRPDDVFVCRHVDPDQEERVDGPVVREPRLPSHVPHLLHPFSSPQYPITPTISSND